MKTTKSICAVCATTILLAGCGDHSLSGTYVSHQATGAELMQLTQTPDHRLTGTIQKATLMNDEHLNTSTVNVAGVVDGDNLILTIYSTPLPIGENFGGTATRAGLDFTIPAAGGSAQAHVSHFDRGSVEDYDVMVSKLADAGATIAAQRQREQQVDALNRSAEALTRDLDAFVARAHQVEEHTPRMVAFYARAVSVEQAKLARAQQLAATGNNIQLGQSQVLVGQMGVDRSQIDITGGAIGDAQLELTRRQATLNTGLERFNGICLGDTSSIRANTPAPDMGPCKTLSRAYVAYRGVLGPAAAALANAAQTKAEADERLARIMRTADEIH